jgi:rhamnosyltransferase
MSLPRAVGLALSNIASDYRDAIKANLLRNNALSIPQFRFAQFIGAWEGFRGPDQTSARLLERFYYPAESQSNETPPAPGRRIVYSEDP